MTPSEMPKVKRLQMDREVLRRLLKARYKSLEDAIQEVSRIRYNYFKVRKAYYFIDHELATIDGRLKICESTGLNKPTKTKEQEAVEELSKEQLTELIAKLELLKEKEEL